MGDFFLVTPCFLLAPEDFAFVALPFFVDFPAAPVRLDCFCDLAVALFPPAPPEAAFFDLRGDDEDLTFLAVVFAVTEWPLAPSPASFLFVFLAFLGDVAPLDEAGVFFFCAGFPPSAFTLKEPDAPEPLDCFSNPANEHEIQNKFTNSAAAKNVSTKSACTVNRIDF